MKDCRCCSSAICHRRRFADLKIDEPSIYFGELSNDYVIVRTQHAGVPLPARRRQRRRRAMPARAACRSSSLWRKLLFALRFGSYQIILNDGITPESRILFNRHIRERVERIAPFLSFDRDPYLVLAEGRLYWLRRRLHDERSLSVLDAGAAGINYIRNSVKFVIDAYDGTTDGVPRRREAIRLRATYAAIFPDMFKPLAEMPAAIREHVRYPEDIFAMQAQVYATYHMTQPAVFYNREDQWEIPTIDDGNDAERRCSRTTRSCGCPARRRRSSSRCCRSRRGASDNLAAWLVARSDGEHYGRLRVFEFPKQKLVFGPRQVVARINQDQVISPQITLWNQQGSQVIWGTLMVIPIEESLIYVRPLYLRASGGTHPGADARHRRLREPDRDGGDARRGSRAALLLPLARQRAGAAAGRLADADAAPTTQPPAPTSSGAESRLPALAAEAQRHYERAIAGAARRRLGDLRRGDCAARSGSGAHARAVTCASS